MKNILIFLLLGFLLFFAFSGIGTAEEAGGGDKVLIILDAAPADGDCYNSSHAIGYEDGLGTDGGGDYNPDKFDYNYYGCEYDGGAIYFEELSELLKELLKVEVPEHCPEITFLSDSRIAVSCRKEDVAKVKSLFKQLLPKRKMYDTRIMMFACKNSKDHGYVASTFAGISEALASMKKNGYEARLDFTTSLIPNNHIYLKSTLSTSFVADYDGLIASAAGFLDPKTNKLSTGTSLGLELQEVKNGLTLDIRLARGFTNSMQTSHVRGQIVEKPNLVNELMKTRFNLTLNAIRTSTFSAGGEQHIIIVQVR